MVLLPLERKLLMTKEKNCGSFFSHNNHALSFYRNSDMIKPKLIMMYVDNFSLDKTKYLNFVLG